MYRNRLVVAALALATSACAAGLCASVSSGDAKTPTLGLVRQANNGFYDRVETGAKAASAAFGDRLVVAASNDPQAAIDSLVAQHVDAIAVDPGYAQDDLTSALTRANKAGIVTVAYDRPLPESTSVWVRPASAATYAHALADSLAAQMGEKGRYALVPCAPADAIVQTWLKLAKAYIRTRYPHMRRIAVVYGNDAGDEQEVRTFVHLIKTHRRLRGLIALCPTEAYVVPQAIIDAGKVGKVFAAGNGGADDCPPFDTQLAAYIRQGAEQVVCSADPAKLGYLTAWAERYVVANDVLIPLPGGYDVGGPVGRVSFYPGGHQLRLDQPLTVTTANLDQYSGG